MNKCISEFTFAFLRSRREAPLRVRSERRRSSRIRSFKEKSPLLPLPLLGEKTISTSGDRYDHLFPTFALGLIKDFFLPSLLFSLSFFFHIPRNCRGTQEDDLREGRISLLTRDPILTTRPIEFASVPSAKNNTPGNPVRLLPALFHWRNETRRDEAFYDRSSCDRKKRGNVR